MVVMDTADAANHRIGVLRIFILCSAFLKIFVQGNPVTPLPTTRHVYHSQAKYFPPEMRRRWRLEVLHEKYLDELSGDGPIETSGSTAATVESSIAVPQLPSTVISVVKSSPFPEDVSEVINSVLSVDMDTDFTEPMHDTLHRSSVEFEGPSSLLNTLLFRPSFSSLTPIINTLPVSTTDVSEGLSSDPIDQWQEFFETSSSKYSRKAISSDTMIVIVTEIRATYIYNTRWSPDVPGTPLASSFGLSVITHTSVSSSRTAIDTTDILKPQFSSSSTFLYSYHTANVTSALSRMSMVSTRTVLFTSGASVELEISSGETSSGFLDKPSQKVIYEQSYSTRSDFHGHSFSISPSHGSLQIVSSYESEGLYSKMLSRVYGTFSVEETPVKDLSGEVTDMESDLHKSSTPKFSISMYSDSTSTTKQPDLVVTFSKSSFETGKPREISEDTASNEFSVSDYFTGSSTAATVKSTYATHPPRGHSTAWKSISDIETNGNVFTDSQNLLKSSFLSISEFSSSPSGYHHTESLTFVLPHISDLPETESDYYDLSSHQTWSHFDKGVYEELGSSDSLRYEGSLPADFSPATMEMYIPLSGKPYHSLWTALYESEFSDESIPTSETELDIHGSSSSSKTKLETLHVSPFPEKDASELPEMDSPFDLTTIYDILVTTHHVQARSLSSDTEHSSFSDSEKHSTNFESTTIVKSSEHFPVSKITMDILIQSSKYPVGSMVTGNSSFALFSTHVTSTAETIPRRISLEETPIPDSSKSPSVFCTENISANVSFNDKMNQTEENCFQFFITPLAEVDTSLHASTSDRSIFLHASSGNSSAFFTVTHITHDFRAESLTPIFSRRDTLFSSSDFEEMQNETYLHSSDTPEFSSTESMLPTLLHEFNSKSLHHGKYNQSDTDFAKTRISPSEETLTFIHTSALHSDTVTKVSEMHTTELYHSVTVSSFSSTLPSLESSQIYAVVSSRFQIISSPRETSELHVITPVLKTSGIFEKDSQVTGLQSSLYSGLSGLSLKSFTFDSSTVLSTHEFVSATASSAIHSSVETSHEFSTLSETSHTDYIKTEKSLVLVESTLKSGIIHTGLSSPSGTAEQVTSEATLFTVPKSIFSGQILQTTAVTPLHSSMPSLPGVHLSVSSGHISHLDSGVSMSSFIVPSVLHTIASGISPMGDTPQLSATRPFLMSSSSGFHYPFTIASISPSSVIRETRSSLVESSGITLKSVQLTKSVSIPRVSTVSDVHFTSAVIAKDSSVRLSSPSPRTEVTQTSIWTPHQSTRHGEIASDIVYSDVITGLPTMEEEDSSSTQDTVSGPPRDPFLLENRNFWILTVLETPFLKELPNNFSHTMELRLANAYSLAFSRFRVQRDLSRKEDPPVYVSILTFTNNVVQGTVELIYIVERGGTLVPAAEAAAAFNLLRHEQLRQFLGYDTIVKATPYHPLESPIGIVQPTVPVSAIVGGILGSLLILLCCLWLYCRCCRPAPSSRRSSQRSLSSYGKHNRQQIFQEDSHHITIAEEIVKEGTSEGTTESKSQTDMEQPPRPLPQIPIRHNEYSPERPEKRQKDSKVSRDVDSDRHRGTTQRVIHQDSYPLPDIESPRRKRARKPLSPDDAEKAALNADIQGAPGDLFHYVPSSPPPFLKKSTMDSRHLIDSTAQNQDISSPAASRCGTGDSEGSEAALLPDSERMVEDTRSDTDTDAAETQLHLAQMRRRISELLDDAFAVAGGRNIYGSLRSKRIGPTPEPFHRFTSFRSAGKRRARSAAGNYQLTDSLPFLDPMNRPQSAEGHHPVDTHGEESSSRVPKSVWSFGSECHQVSENLSASDSLLQDPHSEDKLASSQSCRFMLRTSRSQFGPSSSMPMLDTLHEHPSSPSASQSVRNAASELYLAHSSYMNPAVSDEYDEIDVISAVRDGEPVAAIIQAIKDELQKFNSSLPGTNQNESFA